MKNIFKKSLFAVILIVAIVSIGCESDDGGEGEDPGGYNDTYNLSLRETGPAGGLIFYINSNADTDGWKYLEAAPSDQSTSQVWIEGGSTQSTLNGNTDYIIGAGLANTNAITAQTGHTGSAAQICLDYSIVNNGVTFDDWFLPSGGELNEMNTELYANGVGGFTDDKYWSSRENTANDAFMQFFGGSNSQAFFLKDNTFKVRAIRAF